MTLRLGETAPGLHADGVDTGRIGLVHQRGSAFLAYGKNFCRHGMGNEGYTIGSVSHDMTAITRLYQCALLFESGQL